MSNPNDSNDNFETLFRELKRTEEAQAPSFQESWQRATGRVRSGNSRAVPGFAVAGLAAILLIAALLLYGNRTPREVHQSIPAPAISQWKSPTDFLMKPATQPWLNTMPRFGESLRATQTGSSGNQE